MNTMSKIERNTKTNVEVDEVDGEKYEGSKLSKIKAVHFCHQKNELDMGGSLMDLENVAIDIERAAAVLNQIAFDVTLGDMSDVEKINYMAQEFDLHSRKLWASFESVHDIWCKVKSDFPDEKEDQGSNKRR